MAKRIPVLNKLWPRARKANGDEGEEEEFRGSEDRDLGFPGSEAEVRSTHTHADAAAMAYPTHRRLLTAREEIILTERARAGDPAARQAMMEANIRLVMSI